MSRPTGSKSRIVILFLACAALAIFYIANTAKQAKSPNIALKTGTVLIDNQKLNVYVAETEAEREAGLSVFNLLEYNQGMLFIFPEVQRPAFWMKDMKFPIDIIWINNNQVADITKNLPVESSGSLTRYYPNVDINRVLEVNAGWSDRNNIKIGDKIEMNY